MSCAKPSHASFSAERQHGPTHESGPSRAPGRCPSRQSVPSVACQDCPPGLASPFRGSGLLLAPPRASGSDQPGAPIVYHGECRGDQRCPGRFPSDMAGRPGARRPAHQKKPRGLGPGACSRALLGGSIEPGTASIFSNKSNADRPSAPPSSRRVAVLPRRHRGTLLGTPRPGVSGGPASNEGAAVPPAPHPCRPRRRRKDGSKVASAIVQDTRRRFPVPPPRSRQGIGPCRSCFRGLTGWAR